MNIFALEIRQMMDQLILGDDQVADWIKSSKSIGSIQRIPGDASTRKYYRVCSHGGSYVIMRMEPFLDLGTALPFLSVREHLAQSGVDVPQVIDIDPARGFILLEDLGDITLLRRLQEVGTADVERHLYERVIDALVKMQVAASPQSGGRDVDAFHSRF